MWKILKTLFIIIAFPVVFIGAFIKALLGNM